MEAEDCHAIQKTRLKIIFEGFCETSQALIVTRLMRGGLPRMKEPLISCLTLATA